MEQNMTKSGLGMILSRLKGFDTAKVRVEQYVTEPEIAADVLWNMKMQGDIGKVSADLGAGTGILGLGIAVMSKGRVYMVENDKDALKALRDNARKLESEGLIQGEWIVVEGDVKKFKEKCDVVVMNPPFGTKVRHADREFLVKAFEIADVVYSFHKSSTERFAKAISEDNGFRITHKWDYEFRLKKTMKHHLKAVEKINASCYRFRRIKTRP